MMMSNKFGFGAGSFSVVAFALAMQPARADACGGMFCDTGPLAMPVDQTGENILFVWQGDTIEAHIQIQYVGEAAKFSWVIPLQSLPEFEVGSEPLFQALLAASVPTYGYSQTFDDCGDSSLSSTGGSSASTTDSTSAASSNGDSDSDSDDGGPQVVLTETVGAFEITVLQGGTGQEVFDWLADNGYQQDDEALPILDAYLDEGHLFAAVKLTGSADVQEIHPIVLRFQGSEPCVPLRLTRIAAVENMAIRSFFLGTARAVPRNYRHVLLNPLKVNWLAPSNYSDVVTLAVDEENADGRAFVTEYAGASDVVQSFGIHRPSWNASTYGDLAPELVGAELIAQDLLSCDFDFGNGCTFTHPLLEGILAEQVTPPMDVASAEYWANQDSYPEVDLTAWDGAAFSATLSARIIDPGAHAIELLLDNPYLTRMFTTISPVEMTEDPEFIENAALPDVPNLRNGVLRTLCNGDQVFTLPDGREIYLPRFSGWPDFPDQPEGVAGTMPSSEIIEEVPAVGAPIVLVTNADAIEVVRVAWNAAHGWPGSGAADESGSGGSGDSSEGSGGFDGDDDGCNCSAARGGSFAWAIAGLALLGLRRRASRKD